jgi:hypothetical protein
MDRLFFNRGQMFFREQQAEGIKEKAAGIENLIPDVRELLDYMDQDSLFRHEVLVYFYKYRKKNVPYFYGGRRYRRYKVFGTVEYKYSGFFFFVLSGQKFGLLKKICG